MTENFSWSASAGRWIGIPVRVHLFLLLFIAVVFAIELNFNADGNRIGTGTGIVTVVLLILSIAIHEIAHLFAISNLGGHVNTVVLMPWGGNSDFVLPAEPRARGAVFFAGPFINGAIFALGAALLVQSGQAEFAQLTNPFRPNDFEIANWQISLARITTWLNFQLMIVNLIPCYPFDGACLVRAWVDSLNYNLPKIRVESAIMVMGHAVAFTMIGMSLLLRDFNWGPIHSSWTLLLFAGIILIFAARFSFHEQTKTPDDVWDDGPDTDYESYFDENSHAAFDFSADRDDSEHSKWLTQKQQDRLDRILEREAEEDRLADEILKKLHGDGLKSLSTDERLILDRVSARIRRRRQQGVQ